MCFITRIKLLPHVTFGVYVNCFINIYIKVFIDEKKKLVNIEINSFIFWEREGTLQYL